MSESLQTILLLPFRRIRLGNSPRFSSFHAWVREMVVSFSRSGSRMKRSCRVWFVITWLSLFLLVEVMMQLNVRIIADSYKNKLSSTLWCRYVRRFLWFSLQVGWHKWIHYSVALAQRWHYAICWYCCQLNNAGQWDQRFLRQLNPKYFVVRV